MRRTTLTSWIGIGVLAAATAAAATAASRDSTENPPRPALRPGGLRERGYIPYLRGATTEGPIHGGGHLLLVPGAGGREPYDGPNHPSRLHTALAGDGLRLRPEIRQGQTDQPLFASNWWSQSDNGVAARWNSTVEDYGDRFTDPDNLSPTEKYDLLFYPGQAQVVPETWSWSLEEMRLPVGRRSEPVVRPAVRVAGPATAWELQNHGLWQSTIPEGWWGHCNGWASYTMAEGLGPPRRNVRVKVVNGDVTECAPGESGCVFFRMADIEALMTELYFNDASTMSGRRCDVEPDAIERDPYGRPRSAECRDLQPATLHVALVGLLGVGAPPLGNPGAPARRQSFAIDIQAGREVWTYPVQSFAIDEIEEVDGSGAMRLVCAGGGASESRCRSYRFNENAVRFARVKSRARVIAYQVSRASLLRPPLERATPVQELELHYVLEMDGAGRILGGEWIRDPELSGGLGNKLAHPDFLWLTHGPVGYGEGGDDRGGSSDNPYLSYPNVRALLALAATSR